MNYNHIKHLQDNDIDESYANGLWDKATDIREKMAGLDDGEQIELIYMGLQEVFECLQTN